MQAPTFTGLHGQASSGLPVDPHATLSKYLPEGAAYFYGFPSGNGSDFFNNVPSWVEELVSARTLVCAGLGIRPVVFEAASTPQIRHWLEQECGVALTKEEDCIQFPAALNDELSGSARNEAVKHVLRDTVPEGKLFMAQPFLDGEVNHLFHLDPKLSAQFNDKTNLGTYIPEAYLPARYVSFDNGAAFASATISVPFPCVVKVASSSAGDGVRICRSVEDVQAAKETFKGVIDGIFIEEFVEAVENYCIQFGIPFNAEEPIEIIGYNHQVITDVGEFLGSVVCPPHVIANPLLYDIFRIVTTEILPSVRKAGWYGVGGLDVLISTSGKPYFIDPNFRQTATFGLVSLSRRGLIPKKAVGFIGTFTGSEEAFAKVFAYTNPKSSHHLLQMISMSRKGDLYRFNAGLLYENQEELVENVRLLKSIGIEGKVIDLILEGHVSGL